MNPVNSVAEMLHNVWVLGYIHILFFMFLLELLSPNFYRFSLLDFEQQSDLFPGEIDQLGSQNL